MALTADAFRQILERFRAPLFRFVRHLISNIEDVHDIVQDVFVDAWRAAKRQAAPFTLGGDEAAVRKWLFHAAYCDAISLLRHRRVITWEPLDPFNPPEMALHNAPESFEDRVADALVLHAALAHLKPQDIACLQLGIIEDLSAAELAAILEITPEAARQRLSRALRRLRAAYLAEEAASDDTDGGAAV